MNGFKEPINFRQAFLFQKETKHWPGDDLFKLGPRRNRAHLVCCEVSLQSEKTVKSRPPLFHRKKHKESSMNVLPNNSMSVPLRRENGKMRDAVVVMTNLY